MPGSTINKALFWIFCGLLEGWTTTLPGRFSPAEIIALYADHATHEQFHAEFKSDMDLERLPNGKFETNDLVCRIAAVAMNRFSRRHHDIFHGYLHIPV